MPIELTQWRIIPDYPARNGLYWITDTSGGVSIAYYTRTLGLHAWTIDQVRVEVLCRTVDQWALILPPSAPYDTSPGDVISATGDGVIVLDDGITTYNPLKAAGWLAEENKRLLAQIKNLETGIE